MQQRAGTYNKADLEATLQLILKKAVKVLGGRAGVVATWNEARNRMVASAAYGLDSAALHYLRPLLNEAAPDLAGSRESQDLISELRPDRESAPSIEGIRQNSIIALPLKIGEISTGLIFILRPLEAATFSNMDQPILSAFAEQAAIAIQNARLAHLLSQEKHRTESILENSADGIMSIDSFCRILGFNTAMEKLTGYLREEVIDRECLKVLNFRNWEGEKLCLGHCPMLASNTEGTQTIERQGKIQSKDGRDIDVSIKYSLVRGPEGEPINAVANIRDITQDRQLENLRETFLAMLGHELQTPLSIIKGYSSALAEGKWDRETLDKGLKIIEEESDRLSRVMSRLLLVSRITGGFSPLNMELVNLPNLAGKIVRRRQRLSDLHFFETDFEEGVPPVTADPQMIEEVLDNLVDNAVKYSPAGGKISISVNHDNEVVKVTVSDEGMGISEKGQKHLFERFYRVERGPGQVTKGLGLGLFICKTIIEAHGGAIRVSSREGKGSQFTFSLPIRANTPGSRQEENGKQ